MGKKRVWRNGGERGWRVGVGRKRDHTACGDMH